MIFPVDMPALRRAGDAAGLLAPDLILHARVNIPPEQAVAELVDRYPNAFRQPDAMRFQERVRGDATAETRRVLLEAQRAAGMKEIT